MDMNDILDQWDKLQKQQKKRQAQHPHGKKANADHIVKNSDANNSELKLRQIEQQQKIDNARKINPMVVWMNRYGVVDKDKMIDNERERQRQESYEYLREMHHEAVIDLHGLTADEARLKLDSFVSACQRKGLRKILIIHGKGNHTKGSDPILGKAVRSFIEGDKRLGMSGHPEKKHGGSGATWVIIK